MPQTRSSKPSGPPHAASPQRRGPDRDHILRVAAALFRKHGFERTTLRDIAKGCGCLLGSLYYRYPSKDALLVDMADRAVHEAAALLRAAIESAGDPLERLRQALRAHVRQLAIENDMYFALLFEWRGLGAPAGKRMIALRDGFEGIWDEILGDVGAAGFLRPDVDRRLLRLILLGALNWTAAWYRPKGRHTPEEIADTIWKTVTMGAKLPAPANVRRGKTRH